MLDTTWFRRALRAFCLAGAAVAAPACSSTGADDPVAKTSSSLTVAPLGAREKTALAARAGGESLRLDKGGKVTKDGVVYAAAPTASGRWGFAVVDENGTASGFRFVERKGDASQGTGGATTSKVHTLADVNGGGGPGSCDYGGCAAANSAAASAFADFVIAADDEWTALFYGLIWYTREVERENACRSC